MLYDNNLYRKLTSEEKLESLKSILLYREVKTSTHEEKEVNLPPLQVYFPNSEIRTIGYEIFYIKTKTGEVGFFEFVPSKFRWCPEKWEKLKKDLNMS